MFEAYDRVALFESAIECSNAKEFIVSIDNGPNIIKATSTEISGNLTIFVEVEGEGEYEYSLDGINGPFQGSNVFEDLPTRLYTVYVRDKNGCGTSKSLVTENVSLDGFPKFFTPNGDGVNDFWQFKLSSETRKTDLGPIAIFNRYGVLLLQIESDSKGWDGTLNGRPLPASDYWFRVFMEGNRQFKGHFALKR